MEIGTKVMMINCIEAIDHAGRIWTTRSHPWRLGCGDEVVLLEGKTGGFHTSCLLPVENIGTPRKAITLYQPWAHLVIHGGKNIENRLWRTKHRGPLLIHASKGQVTRPQYYDRNANPVPGGFPEDMQHGGIIGVVDIVDIDKNWMRPWAMHGFWHWFLVNPRPLPFIPCSGKRGIWELDSDLIKETESV